MNLKTVGVRLAIFLGVLVLTLLPGPVGLALIYQFEGLSLFVNYAWLWQIMATMSAGIARIEFDGNIYLSNWGWLVAAAFWVVIGLACATSLRRLRLAYYVPVSLLVILASGILAYAALSSFGYALYLSP